MPPRTPSQPRGPVAAFLLTGVLSACAPDLPAGPATAAYFGDPHVHTGASADGCSSDLGESGPFCGPALDVAGTAADHGLDWLGLADHADGPQARTNDTALADWRAVIDAGLAASEVLVLAGAEVNLTTPDGDLGHHTLLLFADDVGDLTRADASPSGTETGEIADCAAFTAWADGLSRFGPALLMPHHPAVARPMPIDWGCVAAGEPVVELYSHWGNSRSWRSDPEPWADYDPIGFEPADTVTAGTAAAALARHPELRLGFGAGTDGHRAQPGDVCNAHSPEEYGGGLTAAVLPAEVPLSREALHDAFLARHTYATTGPRVPVAVDIFVDGAWVGAMGDEVALGGPADVTVRLTLGDPATWDDDVVGAFVVQPGAAPPAEVRTGLWRVAPGEYLATLRVDAPAAGTPAYVELVLAGPDAHPDGCVDEPYSDWPDDTERVWTSPTWFTG